MFKPSFSYLFVAVGCFLFSSALSQNAGDHCIATEVLGNELNVPPGTVCFECVVNGIVDHNATFEINNNLPTEVDGVTVVYGLLVVFNTSATFHPSTETIVRCSNNEIQSSVYLDVYQPPVITGDTTVNEGGTLSLNCDSSNSNQQPPVTWFYQTNVVSNTALLTLPDIVRSQAGNYTCQTSPLNLDNSTSSSVDVVVQFAPDVTADREDPVDVPVNGTLQISCTYSSNPRPDNITWIHNSSLGPTPLDPADPRITISFNATSTTLTTTLTITEVMKDEGGSYECRVGNNSATTLVNIEVSEEPLILVKASFNDTRCDSEGVCPNDPLLFTCTVTESEPSIATIILLSREIEIDCKDNNTERSQSFPIGVSLVGCNVTDVDGPKANYIIELVIERASLLNGSITCRGENAPPRTLDKAECPLLTESHKPVNLHQNDAANTEHLAMVQWQSGSNSSVNYTVTVASPSPNCSATADTYEQSNDVYFQNISIPCYNEDYIVDVIAINYCNVSSVPATRNVSIKARVPPQPKLSVKLHCDTPPKDGRYFNISWMYGKEEAGVVYPGNVNVNVTVAVDKSDNIIDTTCPDVRTSTNTSCIAYITEDGNYTITLTLSNDVGKAEPVTNSTPSTCNDRRKNGGSLSTGAAVTISIIITLLVSLPVGLFIGICATYFKMRRGREGN